ncbi:hypothetical protein Bca4012_058367 [Brassica carinata]
MQRRKRRRIVDDAEAQTTTDGDTEARETTDGEEGETKTAMWRLEETTTAIVNLEIQIVFLSCSVKWSNILFDYIPDRLHRFNQVVGLTTFEIFQQWREGNVTMSQRANTLDSLSLRCLGLSQV